MRFNYLRDSAPESVRVSAPESNSRAGAHAACGIAHGDGNRHRRLVDDRAGLDFRKRELNLQTQTLRLAASKTALG